MSAVTQANRAERKALLTVRAELDRQRVALAVHELKAIVAPSSVGDRVDSARPIAATVISLMAPLVGRYRLARWLRVASFALVAIRLARNWRDRRR
jgi:hypothetical protein